MAAGDIILSGGIVVTPEDLLKIAAEVEKLISSNSKDPGEWEEVKSLSGITSLPVLQSLGASYKLVRVAVEILKGVDGHDVEFQVDADRTAIQWRKVSVSGGEPSEWKTLIQLSYMKGDAGETPEFRKGDTGLEWKYKSEEDTAWRTLVAIDDLRWHFADLTENQIAELWRELPDDVLAEFQAPALEAAEVANAGADRANKAAEAAELTNAAVSEQEAERIKAEATRIEAETERVAAEQERSISEIARKDSETKRAEAEALRGSNESERQTAETERKESETARKEAETLREVSESERNTAENLRKEAETARTESESSRVQAEADRVKAEQARTEAEVERTKTENIRKDSESVRALSEEQRINAEVAREEAESVRGASEEEREAAETVRQTQEETRQTDTASAIQKAEAATAAAKLSTALMDEMNAHPMKPQAGLWYRWNPETDTYEDTGIQAKGDPGQSFKIIGQYDTLDELNAAIPDGTGIDGVYAVGASDPFNYYAWIYKEGKWQWVDQGQIKGEKGDPGTGNIDVPTGELMAGRKYLFVPSADGSATGTLQEFNLADFIPEGYKILLVRKDNNELTK